MGEQQTIQDAEGPLRAARPLHLKDKISAQHRHSLCRRPLFVNEMLAFVFPEGPGDKNHDYSIRPAGGGVVPPPRFEGSCGVLGG